MNLIWISMGALGGLFFLFIKGKHALKPKDMRSADASEKSETTQDRVEQALASGDVEAMASALKVTDEPVLRDALLGQIVAIYYRQRSETEGREAFYRYAGQHIDEISAVLNVLERSDEGRPVRVESFKMLAIAMGEDKRYDEAIEVCKTALSLGLENGTKTGFEGRIARLEKKRDVES